jgi:hypothetical protein
MLTSTLPDVEEAGPVGTPMGSRPPGARWRSATRDCGEPVHVELRCRSARCAHRLFIANDRELSGNVRLSSESQPLSPVVAQGKTGRVRPYRDLRVGNPLVAGSSPARPASPPGPSSATAVGLILDGLPAESLSCGGRSEFGGYRIASSIRSKTRLMRVTVMSLR